MPASPCQPNEPGPVSLSPALRLPGCARPAVSTASYFILTHQPLPLSGAMAPANYVVRTNTTGGLRPAKCDAPPGEWVTVPYSGTGEGYLCL